VNGRIRKRGTRYEVFLELGEQDAQRCPTCRKRFWTDDERHEACPKCDGELEPVVARRERWIGSYGLQKEATTALKNALVASEHGELVDASRLTVAQYMREWAKGLDARVKDGTMKPSTAASYKGHIDGHIIPGLGYLRLQSLTARHVDRFQQELADKDGRGGGRLSPATRRHIHVTLHSALHDAKRKRLIGYNPADDAQLAPADHEPIGADQVWSVDQLTTFLKSVENDRLGVLWQFMGTTGLRRGEALGLKWSDVDLDGATLRVADNRVSVNYVVHEGDPKSRAGKRPMPLLPVTVAALRKWKAQQNAEHLKWGAGWHDTGYVFTREDGAAWHPDFVSKKWAKTVAGVKVPRIRLHDLRHGFATMHIAAGTSAKHLQLLMGHSRIGVTMDAYVHPDEDDLTAAQGNLSAALAGKS
jgi:integrase